jgi:hypothetical protein
MIDTLKPAPYVMVSSAHAKMRRLPPPQILLVPAAIILLLWAISANRISFVEGFAAYLLLLFAWWSYWHWQRTRSPGMPVFALASLYYWIYFALELFLGGRSAPDWRHWGRQLSEAAITETMLLVLFGVCFFWLGMRSKLGRAMTPKRLPDIPRSRSAVMYVQGIAALGVLLTRYQDLPNALGAAVQLMRIFESTVTMAAVAILFRWVLDGKAGTTEKAILVGILVLRAFLGITTGWLGSILIVATIGAMIYLQKYHKLPIAALLCVVFCGMFFQAGKTAFRGAFWRGNREAGSMEKAQFWVDASLQQWEQAYNDPSGAALRNLLTFELSRASLLNQAANVLEQTPTIVPYQYGRLYSYALVTLIPRFLWPDKPSMNEANQFYQVAYGVTAERDLGAVSISVGMLTEGYINFNWFGTAMVMFLMGVLLDFWNRTFLGGRSMLLMGVGIVLLNVILSVESNLAQALSGIIQQVFFTVVVFIPVIRWRRSASIGSAVADSEIHNSNHDFSASVQR